MRCTKISALFRMECGPCKLCLDKALPADHLQEWFQENCLDHSLSLPRALAAQLAKGLEVEEKMLCMGVESVLTDLDAEMISVWDCWLQERGISLNIYLDQVRLVGEDCDGFFIWSASCWLDRKITVASMDGLWSSMDSGEGEEVSLVFTENEFHCLLLVPKLQEEENLVYELQPPDAAWSTSSPLLWSPVSDLDDVQMHMGFIPKAEHQTQPLLKLLTELSGRTVQVYKGDLQVWLQEYKDYEPLRDWLQWSDIPLSVYIEQLSSNTPPNGMEVLAAMTVLHFHITIIQGDQVWTSRPDEVQIMDLTLLLLLDGVVFCDHINIVPRESQPYQQQEPGVSLLDRLGALPEQDSGDSEESLSNYYVEGQRVHSKVVADLTCPVCLLTAGSVLQLQGHLHEFHSDSKPYACKQCSPTFLLFHDLRTHIQNVHQPSWFSYVKCTFSTSTHSKIHKHTSVHAHWKHKCSLCPIHLSSQDVLREHVKWHIDDRIYPCMQYDKQFSLLLACQIHICGKHGIGYHCVKCDRWFDAPIQKCCHKRKCGGNAIMHPPEANMPLEQGRVE